LPSRTLEASQISRQIHSDRLSAFITSKKDRMIVYKEKVFKFTGCAFLTVLSAKKSIIILLPGAKLTNKFSQISVEDR